MANRRVDDIAEDLAAVVDFVRQSANGARSGEIAEALKGDPAANPPTLAEKPCGEWAARARRQGAGGAISPSGDSGRAERNA
jgi:hypothetical protein